jgi:hypothetical protein
MKTDGLKKNLGKNRLLNVFIYLFGIPTVSKYFLAASTR